MDGNYICVDVETTGLSFENDRVIQFGCAVFHKWIEIFKTGFYIANTDVANGGFAINGITDEQIAGGYEPEWAFSVIASMMHKVPRVVLAYNAPFDLTFLAHEFTRHKVTYNFDLLKIIDPLVIHRHFNPFTPSPYGKLIHVARKHGIPLINAHDAADDSAAAGHIFASQRLRNGLRGEFSSLHNRQSRWHAEWADSFAAYHSSRGTSVNIVPWPYPTEVSCFLGSEQSLLWESASLSSGYLQASSVQ